KPGEDFALVRDGRVQHVIKRRDPVAGDQQQHAVLGLVEVPNLSRVDMPQAWLCRACWAIRCHASLSSRSKPPLSLRTVRAGLDTSSSRPSSTSWPRAAACLRSVSRNGTPDCQVSIAAACTRE